MKAIVTSFRRDADPINGNQFTLYAEVVFVGTDVPGNVLASEGPNGNGVPCSINITNLAQYPNVIEDALIAEAVRLSLPTLARTDCLFPTYQRGA